VFLDPCRSRRRSYVPKAMKNSCRTSMAGQKPSLLSNHLSGPAAPANCRREGGLKRNARSKTAIKPGESL